MLGDLASEWPTGAQKRLTEILTKERGDYHVITPRFIEELDDEGRLMKHEYPDFGVTDQECDKIGEMCDPYEGL